MLVLVCLPLVNLSSQLLIPYLSLHAILIFMCVSSSPVGYEAFLQMHHVVYYLASFSDRTLHGVLLPSTLFVFGNADHWRPSSQGCFWMSDMIWSTWVLSPLCQRDSSWWNPVRAQVCSNCCSVLWSTGVLSAFEIFQEPQHSALAARSLLLSAAGAPGLRVHGVSLRVPGVGLLEQSVSVIAALLPKSPSRLLTPVSCCAARDWISNSL